MNLLNRPKIACVVALAFALLAASPGANADLPVVDLVNLGQAIKRLQQLSEMYIQGKAQLQQVVLQYDLAVRMAENIPNLPLRYQATFAAWAPISGPDTFGNTSGWLAAENNGGASLAAEGYTTASMPLSAYSTAQLGALPPQAQARVRAQYATMNMADTVQVNSIATVGAIRANSEALQSRMNQLDADSFSSDPSMNTTAALLNKINAADDLILHSIQDSNKLMAALAEEAILQQKAQQDLAVGRNNASLYYSQQFPALMSQMTQNMTEDLENFQFSTTGSIQ
jgi:hypothetical protein